MFEIILEYRVEAQRIASVLVALAAWRWGGAPERASAFTFLILFILPSTFFEFFEGGPLIFSGGGLLSIGIDTAALAVFMLIALYANRNYALWIAGFQLVAMAAHMVWGMVDAVSPLAFAILVIGPSYFQLLLMTVGLVRHIRRKKRHGEYRDWRVPLPFAFNRKQASEALGRQL